MPVFIEVLAGLERRLAGRRLLDVGCGDGAFLRLALQRGWFAIGTELSLATARRAPDLPILVGSLDAIAASQSFDLITLWNVLDQVPDPVALLRACARLLGPGGVVFLRIPNGNVHRRLMRFLDRFAPYPYASGLAPLTPLHPWILRPRDLAALLRIAGLHPLELRGSSTTRGTSTMWLRVLVSGAGRFLSWASRGRLLVTPSIEALARRTES